MNADDAMIDAVHALFSRYQEYVGQGLGNGLDYEALSDCFASEFIASGPAGVVAGKNDAKFIDAL